MGGSECNKQYEYSYKSHIISISFWTKSSLYNLILKLTATV